MTGFLPVRVIVTGPVAAVEIQLDGKTVGRMQSPPWSAEVDLGPALASHELVVRALGPDGKDLASSRQWLNLPRPPAEVEIVLERERGGPATGAQLSWQSVTGEKPKSARASFNGSALAISKDYGVALPAYDPEQVQLLTVELEFENAVRARKDLVLGGRAGEEAGSELTAVPIRVRSGGKTPTAAAIQGSLRAGERSLDVAAVEEGAGILLVVRDSRALRRLGRWGRESQLPVYRADLSLDRQTGIRLFWPRPVAYPGSGVPVELFPTSREFDSSAGGLRWILTRVINPAPEPRSPRFADAVAVAGLNAYGTFRRRAVLLVLEPESEDSSQYRPETVRRFLEGLRVPLFVWSIGPLTGPRAAWTEATDVSSEKVLRDAFGRIKDELAAQRIVWVEGKILPQAIGLAGEAEAIELVR